MCRIRQQIADRRGLWTRKWAHIIISKDGRVVWSSPTSSSWGRRCRHGSRGRRKCFFHILISFWACVRGLAFLGHKSIWDEFWHIFQLWRPIFWLQVIQKLARVPPKSATAQRRAIRWPSTIPKTLPLHYRRKWNLFSIFYFAKILQTQSKHEDRYIFLAIRDKILT